MADEARGDGEMTEAGRTGTRTEADRARDRKALLELILAVSFERSDQPEQAVATFLADLASPAAPGRIIILNGVPRSGKTSIARAIQELGGGHWLNIGVDSHMATLPERLKPGIGLRPGGERPELESEIPALYAALFKSMAAHARLGVSIVADIGIYDGYSRPLGIWQICASCLDGLDTLIVGVR